MPPRHGAGARRRATARRAPRHAPRGSGGRRPRGPSTRTRTRRSPVCEAFRAPMVHATVPSPGVPPPASTSVARGAASAAAAWRAAHRCRGCRSAARSRGRRWPDRAASSFRASISGALCLGTTTRRLRQGPAGCSPRRSARCLRRIDRGAGCQVARPAATTCTVRLVPIAMVPSCQMTSRPAPQPVGNCPASDAQTRSRRGRPGASGAPPAWTASAGPRFVAVSSVGHDAERQLRGPDWRSERARAPSSPASWWSCSCWSRSWSCCESSSWSSRRPGAWWR